MLPDGGQVRGANLTIKESHTNGFVDLFAEWDWDGWIKWQIDLAASAGCNTIRLIGDVAGVCGGTFSQATYESRWEQLIDYCDGIGMYVYVCGGGTSQFGSATVQQITDVLLGLAAEIHGRDTVIGFDIIQEHQPWVVTNGAAVANQVRAVCDRPLTYSYPVLSASDIAAWTARRDLRPFVDFFDYHVYYDMGANDLNVGHWRTETKPLIIGEFGSAVSAGQAAQEDRYESVLSGTTTDAPDNCRVAGVLAWAVTDQDSDPANAWGLFETDGTERTWLTSRLQDFPLV